ncbi:MAG TPA: NADH-quinone oxidoreductase subunit L [Firmicutes bacterium]|nr:NADH-quinone oxidoreductase subunit L [Bacillota bacterium]
MGLIAFLILFPFFAALVLACMRKSGPVRKYTMFAFCVVIMAAVLVFSAANLISGETVSYLPETHWINTGMLVVEWFLMGLIIYQSFKWKKYYCALLSVAQTGLITWLELTGKSELPGNHILSDKLTIIMCLIIGIVGCLICVYAMGYMKDYHTHHTEFKDRRSFFFSMLFVFLGAMFGLVFSSNLTWIYFFWEITSICSFLLIGYNKSKEAINNSFRALWMNLLGGLGFAIAIAYAAIQLKIADLQTLVQTGTGTTIAIIPVILLAFAGLTKSAQLPFSSWLLGAMVAPTPTSALLHSATMVKAGVYLLLRLSPAFYGNLAGLMVTTIGGFTFLATSMLAISQSDGKKVLAYSTVSNLGLITACAGVGMHEAVWAGILLMMFHAVSKSLMFQSVGAVENCLGSRNIEDMHGLIVKLPRLAYVMIVGIAGMFLAPFGMLISKWAALKAYVDSGSILLVIFLIFGSATTLFYWTKWLGTLIAVHHHSGAVKDSTKGSEWVSLLVHCLLVITLCLSFPLASTYLIEPFLMDMFHEAVPALISSGNLYIMAMMLCMIVILPIAVRVLTFGKKNKIITSYMGGANTGDDRTFVDSFGKPKRMYLSNWYLTDYFGEEKLFVPSLVLSAAGLIILLVVAIGGAL